MNSVACPALHDQPGLGLLLDALHCNAPMGPIHDSAEWDRYFEACDTLVAMAQADEYPGYDETDGPGPETMSADDPWIHCLVESWVEWTKRGEWRARELEQLRQGAYELVARKIERGELPPLFEDTAHWDFTDPWDAEVVFTAIDNYRANHVDVSDAEIELLVARFYGSPISMVA